MHNSTALVVITSFRLSLAVASSVVEPMRRPMFVLNAAIQHLTTMDAASTPTLTQLNTIGSGAKILPTLLRSSSTPMARIITATVMPERYSNRPWP